MEPVAVALSGGVDSLRAALLLREMGHEVKGLHMRLLPPSPGGRWSTEEALEEREGALRNVASRFGIDVNVIDCRDLFEQMVIQPFLNAYLGGLTPNPCVTCNPQVKFPIILREAVNLGVYTMATGHYARVSPPDDNSDRYRLFRGLDVGKDQSYFLFGLTQEQLAGTLFPLGGRTKREVLHWARSMGLEREIPRESQEICFIPRGGYQEFLMERHPADTDTARGPILDRAGNVLGEHKGLFAYTIGQRRGLGIASTAPLYVLELDVSANAVRVGSAVDLDRPELTAAGVNWVSIMPREAPLRCSVKIRHQHQPAPALVTPLSTDRVRIVFDSPQRAVTPGQAAVFYDGEMLVGGGIIERFRMHTPTPSSAGSPP
ncbi:MAG: tRNA 2-thiouridine(34) synthase MnmA [Syntrophobacteraceae bacterium]|jgi:tRNA-specific 2-thiouridylase|nr:tRNA 2-thiouridine(34) synthase MnmA [Syntrophobacteraceae bacterium]